MADAASTPHSFDDALDLSAHVIESSEYPIEAFTFVQEGLRHTVDALARNADHLDASARHVSGRELCMGLRDYALAQYGLLARTVLEQWGIERTDDFGAIVFAMVEAGLMRASEDDSAEDFCGVYHFDTAFDSSSVGVG